MKWFKYTNLAEWEIMISPEGKVTEVRWQKGIERRTYKLDAKMHEEQLTGEVLHDAFWTIVTFSREGADYLAKNVKNLTQQQILFEVTMELIDRATEIQRKVVENHVESK